MDRAVDEFHDEHVAGRRWLPRRLPVVNELVSRSVVTERSPACRVLNKRRGLAVRVAVVAQGWIVAETGNAGQIADIGPFAVSQLPLDGVGFASVANINCIRILDRRQEADEAVGDGLRKNCRLAEFEVIASAVLRRDRVTAGCGEGNAARRLARTVQRNVAAKRRCVVLKGDRSLVHYASRHRRHQDYRITQDRVAEYIFNNSREAIPDVRHDVKGAKRRKSDQELKRSGAIKRGRNGRKEKGIGEAYPLFLSAVTVTWS